LTARQSHSLLDTSVVIDLCRLIGTDDLQVVAISIDG